MQLFKKEGLEKMKFQIYQKVIVLVAKATDVGDLPQSRPGDIGVVIDAYTNSDGEIGYEVDVSDSKTSETLYCATFKSSEIKPIE
jgi:hypothetical protein